MSHEYVLAVVKKILNPGNKDVIGEESFLVLVELYRSVGFDIFTVPPSLKDTVRENDLVICDFPVKEVVKVIRDTTREQIDRLYEDLAKKRDKGKQN